MFAFKIAAVQECCALWIQRVWRGHIYGRERARTARMLLARARRLQRWWRGRLGFILLLRRAQRKKMMAIELQRIARGWLGRRLAARRLMDHYRQAARIREKRGGGATGIMGRR